MLPQLRKESARTAEARVDVKMYVRMVDGYLDTTGQIGILQDSLSSWETLLPTGHRGNNARCVLLGTETEKAMLQQHPYLWHHQRVSKP